MSYYKNYWVFMNNPIAGAYLRWAYGKGIDDLSKINYHTNFNREDFSCLLCGVGNERTAEEFIKFVIGKNSSAKIWIIDIADEHLKAIRKIVSEKYSSLDIRVETIDALKLESVIPNQSLDWIETDGLIEFFNNISLEKLLTVWCSLLKFDGFITTRDYISGGTWSIIIDSIRDLVMKFWLKTTIYKHSREDFDFLFKKTGWKVIEGSAFIPTYRRFSLIKNE